MTEPVPTGRTVDAEVGEISLDLGVEHEEPNVLGAAFAAHFGIPIESITGFVLTVEHEVEGGMTLSSAWSIMTPVWRLKAFAREALEHLERQ